MEASGSYLPNARGPCFILYVPVPTWDGKSSTESLQALPGFRDAVCPQGKQ